RQRPCPDRRRAGGDRRQRTLCLGQSGRVQTPDAGRKPGAGQPATAADRAAAGAVVARGQEPARQKRSRRKVAGARTDYGDTPPHSTAMGQEAPEIWTASGDFAARTASAAQAPREDSFPPPVPAAPARRSWP